MFRWLFVTVLLLFALWITDEVVQLSLMRQDRLTMADHWNWVEQMYLDGGSSDTQVNSELSRYAKKEHISIARYGEDGRLIFATEFNHFPIRLKGRTSAFQIKGDYSLYIEPIRTTKQLSGYLLIRGKRTEVIGLQFFYLLLFLGGLSILFFFERLDRSYTMPIRFASRMAESAVNGNYHLIASDNVRHEDVLHMNLNLNRLMERVNELDRSLTRQQNSMETLIENIGNGLILIDGNHRISYINKAFKENFDTDAVHWLMADYEFVVPYEAVKAMIRQVFTAKSRQSQQMHLLVGINWLYFDVSAAPVLDHHSRVQNIVVVFHDITAIKKLESMRKDFVANVSHELRTPITSIIGFTETLLDGAKEDKDSEDQFLQIILHEGQRLKSLIADLLDLSKIERDHFHLDWQNVSLAELLDTVLFMFHDKAAAKQIIIKRLDGPPGHIAGDSFRIRQIMINLITNAVAYTPEQGEITVSVQETSDTASFTVSDTGIGIAADQIPRVFERFYRVDKARSRDSGGTGLGLAIVKHLVEAHDGQIQVSSQPGKGTAFTIIFNKHRKSKDVIKTIGEK